MGKDLFLSLSNNLETDDADLKIHSELPGLGRHENTSLARTKYTITELDHEIKNLIHYIDIDYTELLILCAARQLLDSHNESYKYVCVGYE